MADKRKLQGEDDIPCSLAVGLQHCHYVSTKTLHSLTQLLHCLIKEIPLTHSPMWKACSQTQILRKAHIVIDLSNSDNVPGFEPRKPSHPPSLFSWHCIFNQVWVGTCTRACLHARLAFTACMFDELSATFVVDGAERGESSALGQFIQPLLGQTDLSHTSLPHR